MSRCRVAIIADDLTGALDAAAPFAARGASTRVVIALERLEGALEAWEGERPEVIAVNTESRHLAAVAAAARVERAARCLSRVEPRLWFKKIDSTLRGQVVAESLALRRFTGRRLVLAPAVPAQGRTVCNAEVHVDGIPLGATSYGQDTRAAPPPGALDRLFADQGLPMVRYRPAQGATLPVGDCVCDTADQADLFHVYEAMATEASRWLAVGAAGLATIMAQHLFGCQRARRHSLGDFGRRLYVVGSRSPRAVEQLARLCQASPRLPVSEALRPQAEAPAGDEGAMVLVPGTGAGEESAEAVAAAMGERVAMQVAHWPGGAGVLLLTGGDTAMAALQRLDVESIEVDGEWAPGVVLGRLDGDPLRAVITKAGGFGEPDLLAVLEDVLGAADGRQGHCGQRRR
ncbi:four-carbon acid sugar kinase family protein [Halomonas sp. ANAO-440]|uniref:four-carbon acid sugar kinase family protein n=1 Tax=Halomonas sp. ANAO-440 TaxID=2861360 RepID=UPI001CAA547B|nr:four-carbon acid sugar kinase family protein [Halomonas sp. ANAO-440]MBZ0332231.1 four-carbon acid sugar kinase family protein [Halomonas sp. ANAO-440]